MSSNASARSRNFNPSYTVRAAVGLGLVLVIACAGSVSAEDIVLGFAARTGGTNSDVGQGIAVDASGNVYITGSFNGTVDFDPGPGIFNLVGAGSDDIFVRKLDSAGDFVWAKAMGGTQVDGGGSIVLDSSGNVYTTGMFSGTVDFDPGAGRADLTSSGGRDIFVQKLDSAGNFVWAKAMGGTSSNVGQGIAVDASGNVYTTGVFLGTVDFDPGAGFFNLTDAGLGDIFVSKLDSAGNFVWAKAMGATDWDWGAGIALDASGNVYTTGSFKETVDFDPGPGIFNLTSVGDFSPVEIFVQKLDSAGDFVWAKAMGGTGHDGSAGIALDASGNVYTTGRFSGTADFDPGAGIFNLTPAGVAGIFVSKLNSAGNFVWAKAMGGGYISQGKGIALDASGNVYTTGYFYYTADFDPGAGIANLTSAGYEDIFVSKLDSGGNFVWAKAMGSPESPILPHGGDVGFAIAVDATGNVYTTGVFLGTVDFDPGVGTANLTSAGGHDIFVSKLARTGYLAEAWVDFGYLGSEVGSQANPFNTLSEGLFAVVEAGTVKIKSDMGDPDSDETMTIDQAVTIEAVNGTVSIGDSGGRSADDPAQSGFISRF